MGDRAGRARQRRTGGGAGGALHSLRARRAVAAAVAAAAVVLGPASPAAAQDDGQFEAPTDGGGQALWVLGEVALVVGGTIGGRLWVVRRSRQGRGRRGRPDHHIRL